MEEKTVITFELSDMECYDKILSAYEERWDKTMGPSLKGVNIMGISFKSARKDNIIGLTMIYPDGHPRIVLMAELPMDGDWRADVDFFDEIESVRKISEKWFTRNSNNVII